ncbi:MAG: M48 family metalloprotease [Actinophytocola sp.]|nr:M48 family metalloprotease [Actinophytocola sp.]
MHPQVVLVPTEGVDAFAAGPARIVVTTGMRVALDAGRYAATIAHERCHLEGRHHDLVGLARRASAIHPLLAPMVRHVESLVERAADEAAADALSDRRQVAQRDWHRRAARRQAPRRRRAHCTSARARVRCLRGWPRCSTPACMHASWSSSRRCSR